MQAELQLKVGLQGENAGTNPIDPAHHDIGDNLPVVFLLGGFGEALEIDAVAGERRIMPNKRIDDGIFQRVEGKRIG